MKGMVKDMLTWNEMKKEYLAEREKLYQACTEKQIKFNALRYDDPDEIARTAREYDKAEKIYKDHVFVMKVLRNNLYAVFFNEMIPKIAAIWNKYVGKQYGEKTKEKIQNEINDAFPGITVYAYINYYPKLLIHFGYFVDNKSSACSDIKLMFTRYENDHERFLTESNTIEEMQLVNRRRYIEDVPGYISEVKTKYHEIAEKAAELEKLAESFKKLMIGELDGLLMTNFHIPQVLEIGSMIC